MNTLVITEYLYSNQPSFSRTLSREQINFSLNNYLLGLNHLSDVTRNTSILKLDKDFINMYFDYVLHISYRWVIDRLTYAPAIATITEYLTSNNIYYKRDLNTIYIKEKLCATSGKMSNNHMNI